jgi:hypothetical protein
MGGIVPEVPWSAALALLVSLLSAAVAIGAAKTSLATLGQKIRELERTRDNFGARLEQLEHYEVGRKAVEDERRERRLTGAFARKGAVPKPVDEKGSNDHHG